MLHVKPPPASSSSECSLIRMGQYTEAVFKLTANIKHIRATRTQVLKTAHNMEILPQGYSQSKQNNRCKCHGIMGVVVFIIKQPSSEYITAATENLSDVTLKLLI